MNNTNLIIGKINSGKTTGFLFNEFKKSISNNENILVADEKYEYYNTFKEELENDGYNILVLNLKDTSKNNSFNPLLKLYNYYKNGEKDKAIEGVNKLALELFKTDNKNADPFWANSCADYFTALTLILFENGNIDEINIGSIYTMVDLGEKKIDDISIMKRYFNTLDITNTIYRVGSAVVFAPIETRGSIISVMKQELNKYCIREQLLNNLCGNEIDLDNLNDKFAIFIINKPELNVISNILINQLSSLNIKISYYIDNIDNMRVILELNNILDRKEKIFIATRNKENLLNKYNNDLIDKFENVIDNINKDNLIEIGQEKELINSVNNNAKYFNIEEFVINM